MVCYFSFRDCLQYHLRVVIILNILDIDECKERGGEICIGGSCFNTLGSYECECEPGSALDVSRNICIGNYVAQHIFRYFFLLKEHLHVF